MHWIRFLKLPKAVAGKGRGYHVDAMITITTDLGESFLMNDCNVYIWLEYESKVGELIPCSETIHKWKGGSRQLAVQSSFEKALTSTIRMVVSNSRMSSETSLADRNTRLPNIVTTRAIVSQGADQNSHVERQIAHSHGIVSIYEETGESIARHVWDAGIAFTDHIIHRVILPSTSHDREITPMLNALFQRQDKKKIQVIELGCGCGLVGIALTSCVENCHVVLTDLPEAQDIARLNIRNNRAAKSSQAEFSVLNWEMAIPAHITNVQHDLAIVTDCTYNPSSATALVVTLKALAIASPQLLTVVAMKVRHSSEAVFFDLMDKAGLVQSDRGVLSLPNAETSQESSLDEEIEVYTFRLVSSDQK